MLDAAHICEGAAIAPGSVVTPRKTVGSGDLTAAEKEEIRAMCDALAKVVMGMMLDG